MTDQELQKLAVLIAEKLTAQPRWLKLRQAAVYSGIGQKKLKDLAEQGSIIGYPDPDTKKGCWIFDRLSIDEYRLRPWRQEEVLTQEMLDKIGGLL